MKCQRCNQEKSEQYFNKGENFIFCKECLEKQLKSYNTRYDAKQFCEQMLEKGGYKVNEELLYKIFFEELEESRGRNNVSKFYLYLKQINSLPQYKKYSYDASREPSNHMDCFVIEKSDIDFINDDIKELKIKISNALQKEDFNAHNKWMNSLRDAIELRDKLESKSKTITTTNLFIENGSFELNEEAFKKAFGKFLEGNPRQYK